MTPAWIQTKLGFLWHGWLIAEKVAPPNPNALRLVLAQAIHEDSAGDAWDGYGGWGCCDLRGLTAAEKAAFAAGTLKPGMWLYPDGTWGTVHQPNSIGTIRGDSDPNSGPFHVWFAAFPQGPLGPANMLRTGIRGSVKVLSDPACSVETYATSIYVNQCYYGGVHAGARPCGSRKGDLNDAEKKNVADYVTGMNSNLTAIDAGLAGWTPPGPYAEVPEAWVENLSPASGDDTGSTSGNGAEDE